MCNDRTAALRSENVHFPLRNQGTQPALGKGGGGWKTAKMKEAQKRRDKGGNERQISFLFI